MAIPAIRSKTRMMVVADIFFNLCDSGNKNLDSLLFKARLIEGILIKHAKDDTHYTELVTGTIANIKLLNSRVSCHKKGNT